MSDPTAQTPTSPTLHDSFRGAPIAHRGFHDQAGGRIENSRAAILAAVEAGYGIEIDLQPSSDGVAMVFHDDTLDRVTGATGPVCAQDAASLRGLTLTGSSDTIPTFAEILDLVAGRVPLLVEIKDQGRADVPDLPPETLEKAAAAAVEGYDGPLAFMSFNPDAVARMARFAPGVPRGLTSCGYDADDFPSLPEARRARLRDLADFATTGSSFISHHARDLDRPAVQALRDAGIPVLCWTIRSSAEEASARALADNVTFEGYDAAIPA
ncbi:glycerophosphodiester phosphodiesterase family protein [Pseudooceanicola algae]|uniref:Uncharacterized protein n=1 Tax=Pseudooceanicola algae TaxID=1537215 RepID=A0A418SGK0_9RHOB|nr:glycerophosphodiester phosphodiesterase family protein [Pseudooceanicola algae]QPM91806.1 hypothetical protein PSAL_030610 [Pseudooceanicola algae]